MEDRVCRQRSSLCSGREIRTDIFFAESETPCLHAQSSLLSQSLIMERHRLDGLRVSDLTDSQPAQGFKPSHGAQRWGLHRLHRPNASIYSSEQAMEREHSASVLQH